MLKRHTRSRCKTDTGQRQHVSQHHKGLENRQNGHDQGTADKGQKDSMYAGTVLIPELGYLAKGEKQYGLYGNDRQQYAQAVKTAGHSNLAAGCGKPFQCIEAVAPFKGKGACQKFRYY